MKLTVPKPVKPTRKVSLPVDPIKKSKQVLQKKLNEKRRAEILSKLPSLSKCDGSRGCGAEFDTFLTQKNRQSKKCPTCQEKARSKEVKRKGKRSNAGVHLDEFKTKCGRCKKTFDRYDHANGNRAKNCKECLAYDRTSIRGKGIDKRTSADRKDYFDKKRAEDPDFTAKWSRTYKAKLKAKLGKEEFLKKNAVQSRKWRQTNPDKEKAIQDRRKNKPENALYILKKQAELKNNTWELCDEDVIAMVKQPCMYCGVEPIDCCHGLDRVDNEMGYIEGNVLVACKQCNYMKRDLPLLVFLEKINNICIHLGLCEGAANSAVNLLSHSARIEKYINRAEAKHISFDLSIDQFVEIVSKPCYLCGMESSDDHNNGIDRFDNDLGYTLDNSKPCCGMCNMIKCDMNYDEFIAKCIALINRKAIIIVYHDNLSDNTLAEELIECKHLGFKHVSTPKVSKTCPKCCTKILNMSKAVLVGRQYIHNTCVTFLTGSEKKATHSMLVCVACSNSIKRGTIMIKMKGGNRWKHKNCPEQDEFEWHLAPTSRTVCHRCKKNIAKDTLRAHKNKKYFHFDCDAPNATPKKQLSLAPTNATHCVDCGLVIQRGMLYYELPKGKRHHAECV